VEAKPKLALFALVVVVVVSAAACGGSQVTLTAARVRSLFAAQGLHPQWVFDTRTGNEAQIDRLAPLTSKDPSARKASALARRGLRGILAHGAAHPVTWLAYPTGVEVLVWGKLADAESFAQRESPGFVRRIGNTVVETPAFAKGPPQPLKAALAELSKTK
jgi:hypothetical protein